MLVLGFFFLTIQQIYIFEKKLLLVHIFNYFFYNRRDFWNRFRRKIAILACLFLPSKKQFRFCGFT